MKNQFSLLFLLLPLLSFGQKALGGSVLLQNSGQHYGTDEYLNNLIVTKFYSTVQIPTAALAYMHFGHSGGYVRWYLSGWRYKKVTDEVSTYDPQTGIYETSRGTVARSAGGRIGFARALQLGKIKEMLPVCLEFAATAEWQLTDFSPFTSAEYHRRITTTVTQLGPNLVVHRNFEKGFARIAALLPIFQMKTEYYRIDDPSIPKSGKAKTEIYFEKAGWNSVGLEIGGGFYLGK